MNDNLDLTKILKNYFFNNKFYTTIWGKVRLFYIDKNSEYPIKIIVNINKSFKYFSLTKEGKYNINGEYVFFLQKIKEIGINIINILYLNQMILF